MWYSPSQLLGTTRRRLLIVAVAAALTLDACGAKPELPRDCLGRPYSSGQPPTGTATVTWSPSVSRTDGSPVESISGYRIYYGLSPNELRCQVEISDPDARSNKVTGLTPGTWYFSMVTIEGDSVSGMSEVVSKRID